MTHPVRNVIALLLAIASARIVSASSLGAREAGNSGTAVCGELEGEHVFSLAGSPYFIDCTTTLARGATLTVEAGVEVLLADDVALLCYGELRVLGEAGREVRFSRQEGGTAWDGLRIERLLGVDSTPSVVRHAEFYYAEYLLDIRQTNEAPILIEDCSFDQWTDLAIYWDESHGLIVRRCEFGLNTPPEDAESETINGDRSGAIVEHCIFGRRRGYKDIIDLGDTTWDGPVPIIRYNTFLGGDDDAIDFDDSAGWIIGNLIMDFWPDPRFSKDANGGGITGDELSSPVVLNNVIYRCYHGIGYKNGAAPLIVNNLVLDCHVGVTFRKDECSMPPPRPVLYNNIIWNNRHHETGEPQNVVLNGTWWYSYCQDPEDQAEIDMRYCIVDGGWPGEGNLDADPLIRDPAHGDFTVAAGSPALDSAFGGPFPMEGVDPQVIAELLREDHAGNPREDLPCVANAGAGTALFFDRGPLEGPSTLCPPPGPAASFRRGDGNNDGLFDLSDPLVILLVLFRGDPTDCEDALDVDDNGRLELGDALYLLHHIFQAGPAPPPPFPTPGEDPSEDNLGCDR